MPIKQLVTKDEISRSVDKQIDKLEKDLISMLISLGHLCLDEMEKSRGYTNVTYNLSDSRGFVVVKDKTIVYSSYFKSTLGGTTGRQLASERALLSNGISLIVVAGMEYAEKLEANGKNVITSSELMAEKLVPELLNKLGFR